METMQKKAAVETSPIVNVAAYKFVTLDGLRQRRTELRRICKRLGLRGTILLSDEGINLFVAGTRGAVDALLRFLRADPLLANLDIKESFSDHQPFNRMLVKVKTEIIAFGVNEVKPAEYTSKKLPPERLRQWLDQGKPVTLLDVRNDYEIRLGTFQNAVTLGIDNFRDFPQAARKLPHDTQKHPVVMFCTGGIRCEKAGPYLEQQGFADVYQLEGGILKYFERCGGEHYDGECFVFDQRVALDSTLSETATTQCYNCQSPLTEVEQQSPQYVMHRSCPYCYVDAAEAMAKRLQTRHEALRKSTTPLPGSQPYTNVRPIFVPATADGKTLIEFLGAGFCVVPVEKWRARVDGGFIFRDGQPLTATSIVSSGERLEHRFPDTVEPDVDVSIEILFEDELFVVVNKPAPLPMHPCGRFNRNSLISILNQVYYPQRLRPGHRLDANTSGVVILSRTRAVAQRVQPQFATGGVQKKYIARVRGTSEHGEFTCNAPISATAVESGARTTTQDGLASRTDFKVLKRLADGTTLLEVTPHTGRTNQIRLHLWHLNMPIVGDQTYLPDRQLGAHTAITTDCAPMCLHSQSIRFLHPESSEQISFEAPLPDWAH
jgi:RluA family pseudouridine synthase